MILIDFYPGSLGHLLLRTIKYHWPTVYGEIPKITKDRSDNHDVFADLFLSNQSNITDEQMQKFRSLISSNITVLTHNRKLLPIDEINHWCVCAIICDNSSLATATFLYWYKSGGWHFDFISKNNQNLDFYEACWSQFIRTFTASRPEPTKFSLNFTQMDDPGVVSKLLEKLQHALKLPGFIFDSDWYYGNYLRSMNPCKIHQYIYQEFCYLHSILLKDGRIDKTKPIEKLLDPYELRIFKTSMNLFYKQYKISIPVSTVNSPM